MTEHHFPEAKLALRLLDQLDQNIVLSRPPCMARVAGTRANGWILSFRYLLKRWLNEPQFRIVQASTSRHRDRGVLGSAGVFTAWGGVFSGIRVAIGQIVHTLRGAVYPQVSHTCPDGVGDTLGELRPGRPRYCGGNPDLLETQSRL